MKDATTLRTAFERIRDSILDGQQRELTPQENAEAMKMLLQETSGEDREFSPEEIRELRAELDSFIDESMQLGLASGSRTSPKNRN